MDASPCSTIEESNTIVGSNVDVAGALTASDSNLAVGTDSVGAGRVGMSEGGRAQQEIEDDLPYFTPGEAPTPPQTPSPRRRKAAPTSPPMSATVMVVPNSDPARKVAPFDEYFPLLLLGIS